MLRTSAVVLAIAIAACDRAPGTRDAGVDAAPRACAASDPPPYGCAYAPDGSTCVGDALVFATCVSGAWQCPTGHIPAPDCSAASCLGHPLPGEACTETGWQCTGGPASLPKAPDGHAQCGLTLCLTCAGFAGPFTVDGCTCACAPDGDVRCEPVP